MALREKYLEENHYEFNGDFVDDMRDFGPRKALRIGRFLDKTIPQVEDVYARPQYLGGVINDTNEDPFLFSVELYKDEDSIVTFFSIREIDDDTYLDLINSNSYLDERMDSN